MTDFSAEGTTGQVAPARKPRRNRWVPGVPRRRRKTSDPWQIQALRGLLPLVVVVGFIGLALVLAVLAYDVSGSEVISVVAAGSGLVMAALFTERLVARLLDLFS